MSVDGCESGEGVEEGLGDARGGKRWNELTGIESRKEKKEKRNEKRKGDEEERGEKSVRTKRSDRVAGGESETVRE